MATRGPYGRWSEKLLDSAIKAYNNREGGLNQIARQYQIPKATLKRHLDGVNKFAKGPKKCFGRMPALPQELENELVAHVLDLEKKLFGITRKSLMKLAYDIARVNGVGQQFNNETAGKKWYRLFMARHPQLSLRQPEATSAARATGFSREKVTIFYDTLTEIQKKYNFSPINIYNMDETGLSTVQRPQKIIAMKGRRQVGAITSGERGVNTTCICCMSAAGRYIPPMLIFKRVRFRDELKTGAPPGTKFSCSESGWITKELFVEWLQHFIENVHPSLDSPVLLILDGHTTHTCNLEAIKLAREKGIVMLSLPSHCTHRLQPLDVSFFKPLSTYFNEAADKWMRTNPGQLITQFQISHLLGDAYSRAATVGNAIHGFQKCGIWPIDRNVFSEHEFIISESDDTCQTITPATHVTAESSNINSYIIEREISTHDQDHNGSIPSLQPQLRTLVHVAEISPKPKLPTKKTKRSSKTLTITSTPNKDELEAKQASDKRNKAIKLNPIAKRSFSKADEPSSSGSQKIKKKKEKAFKQLQCESSDSEDDVYCIICLSHFSQSRSREKWIQCMDCKGWAHLECTDGSTTFVCINCDSD